MSGRRAVRSGEGSGLRAAIAVAFVLLAAGVGVSLWATGVFDARPASHAGQIAFPALARPVKAYERIVREDLIDPKTGRLRLMWLDEDQTSPGLLRDLSKILGRVVSRDKQPGYILSEGDFLPPGTRPGVTAGVPAGKRSLSLPAEKVRGLDLLRQGDTFDLLAVLPARSEASSNVEPAVLLGGIRPPDTRTGQLSKQTGIRPLVVGGTMVALTQGAAQSTAGSQPLAVPSTPTGARNRPALVATIAVGPDEVAPLTEALGLGTDLFCVARSGQAGGAEHSPPPPSLAGLVPVAATSRPVAAYDEIGPEDLADAATGRANVFYFRPEQVRADWLASLPDLAGRVAARALPRGSVVRESDLLPLGTRPGIVAGAPSGSVVVPVEEGRIAGLDRLRDGDRFAVYAMLPEELRPAFPLTDWATLQGAVRLPQDREIEEQLRSGVRLVSSGVIRLGVVDTGDPGRSANAKRTEGGKQVVGIAIPTGSVTEFARFLSEGCELFTAAESGRGLDPAGRQVGGAGSDGKGPQTARSPRADEARVDRGAGTSDDEGLRAGPLRATRPAHGETSDRTEPHGAGSVRFAGGAVGIEGRTVQAAGTGGAETAVGADIGDAVRSATASASAAPVAPAAASGRPVPETVAVEVASIPKRFDDDAGDRIAVPVTARPVRASARLTVEDFVDPATGRPRILLFPRDRVGADWIRDVGALIDRVAGRDIDAGRSIREADLLPPGSRAGPTAGIPAGLRGIAVNGLEVSGLDALDGLQRGDRFRIVSARGYDVASVGDAVRHGVIDGDATRLAQVAAVVSERASVTVVCREAVLVEVGARKHVTRRAKVEETETTTTTLLTPEGPVRTESTKTGPRVVEDAGESRNYLFAVRPEEAESLAEALSTGARLFAVAATGSSAEPERRSDAPNEPERRAGGEDFAVRPRIVEHIRGSEIVREVWITPERKETVRP